MEPSVRRSPTADEIRSSVAALLDCRPQDLRETDDLAELGMDSIRIMSMAGWFRRHGVSVTFLELADHPTIAEWSALVGSRLPGQRTSEDASRPTADRTADADVDASTDTGTGPVTTAVDPDAPFALTPVQHAYWIGRRDDQTLGSVGCHAYFEFDGAGLVPERLDTAVRAVIARHGMLRAAFLNDGTQQIAPVGGWPGLTVHDLRHASEQPADERLSSVRDALSHRRLRVELGEVLDVQLSLLPADATRLHLNIDLLVADVESIRILLKDLARAYRFPASPGESSAESAAESTAESTAENAGGSSSETLDGSSGRSSGASSEPVADFGFADYLAGRTHRRAAAREQARAYWRGRLADLPDGPVLPLACDPAEIAAPRFIRRRHRLEPDAWQRFGRRARQGGTTPAMALAAAFAEVLGSFSETPRFLLSLPLFDRDNDHPAVPGMVADFTDLLLLTVDLTAGSSFLERARGLQDEFRTCVAHSAYSGVEVLRDLARPGTGEPRRAPVVFACTLGNELADDEVRSTLGELEWMISQTPQVWLDHQVYESRGGVDLCWDSVDDLFPPDLVDDMFAVYQQLIDHQASAESDWSAPARLRLPAGQQSVRDRVNLTIAPGSDCLLHEGFFARAAQHPHAPALLWGEDSVLTYGSLARRALGVAAALRERGLRPGEPVAISVAKGADQAAAVLGVLAAGGAYVPVGIDQPSHRRRRILEQAGLRLLLAEAGTAANLPSGVEVLDVGSAAEHPPLPEPVRVGTDVAAYVIFTSGTTGEPKGVAVAHSAAWNTVEDINGRFSVGPSDRVLGVSAFDFDLSVYDFFGLLSAGGAVVLPDEAQRRDPGAWAQLIARHRVTVWNSVPVLLDMLLTASAVEQTGTRAFPHLRLALVSGDWIGLDLPGRLASSGAQSCRFAAMGGATEAAIWSNLYEMTGVTDVPAGWTSILYGFPLRNQRFRVVGPNGLDRPDRVAGELWIGGAGVALGYLGDAGLTAAKFVTHEGERWYRTGDRGRYWPDGTLEFLGRVDQQVKIRGVRTEPGEIESALRSHPAIGRCVVAAIGEDRAKRLVAVVTASSAQAPGAVAAPEVQLPDAPTLTGSQSVASQGVASQGVAFHSAVSQGAGFQGGGSQGGGSQHAGLPSARLQSAEAHVVERVLARLAADEAGVTAEPTPFAELARRWGATPEWQPLLRLWLDWLAARGVLTIERDGYAAGPGLAVARAATIDGQLAPVAQRLEQRLGDLAAVVRGELDPLFLLDDPVLAPESLAPESLAPESLAPESLAPESLAPESLVPESPATAAEVEATDGVSKLVLELPADRGPLEIAVLGGGGARAALRLATGTDGHRFTLLDESTARLGAAEKLLADVPGRFAYHRLPTGLLPAALLSRFDVVVADNSLHAYADPAIGAELAALLLAPGGLLLALERTELPPLALIVAAVPTRGFIRLDPVRRARRTSLLPAEEWQQVLATAGLQPDAARTSAADCTDGQVLLRAAKPVETGLPTEEAIRDWLADRLPAAMIPDQVFGAATLPITANGKVDRAALLSLLPAAESAGPAAGEPPLGPVETALAAAWCELLGLTQVGREQNFFGLGGDSLLATRLVSRLRQAGVELDLGAVFSTPVLKDLAAAATRLPSPASIPLSRSASSRAAALLPADPEHRHDPFPPTDVQRAYWTGRVAGLPLGGVGAHYYTEFDGTGLDLARLEAAWNQLISRHEMLRAVFDEQGEQRILAQVPQVSIPVGYAPPGDSEDALAALRAAMSHQVRDPAQWPLIDLRALVYECDGEQRVRLGVSLENIVLDGRSMMIVLAELEQLYHAPDAALPPVDGLSFRDYLLEAAPSAAELETARRYWEDRLADLPPAPRLPLAAHPAEVGVPRFVRRSGLLPADRWQAVTARARAYGLTPSAVLLACYAEVLGRWSSSPELTVNLTLFDRQDVHPGVDDIVGDFTSLLLAAYQPEPGTGFLDRARALQRRLGQDLNHRAWSAVRVVRELAKASGTPDQGMPVVFTSALGTPRALSLDLADWLLPRVWGVSQTPQTWLDNQVYDSARGLHYDWDAVEQLLPPDVVDAMFAAYGYLLDQLAECDWAAAVPDLLPASQRAVRTRVNATAGPLARTGLHQGFFAHARQAPDRTACVWDGGRLSYGELALRALRIAAMLQAHGVRPGHTVAVHLPKGAEQLAAVLGVFAAGAAYVPVGVDQPAARRERLYRGAEVSCVLTESARLEQAPEGVTVLSVGASAGFEALGGPMVMGGGGGLAYVIFTSGSTGVPKGVEVTHQAALNTVIDINDRYGIGPGDRVLAVSALDFDLSVYDIFGPLSVGGAVVLVGEGDRRDAQRWWDLVGAHGVTVWNSVPVLLDMLLAVAEAKGSLPGLRLALVSGDWVGLDLAARLAEFGTATCQLVALGGATEASIWSNAWEVSGPLAGWASVPYGFPLRNQRFRVVGLGGGDCPDWVPGELWIGGAGVALGYRGDPVRTAEKFVWHEGDRWYRTGDLGRYRPDGVLEFLGRTDHQLKINGHRLELGEVEAALTAHPAVHQAVVTADDTAQRRRLVAHAAVNDSQVTSKELLTFLAERLPKHAVPHAVTLWDDLPLTANGKVDRSALATAPVEPAVTPGAEPPRTPAEHLVSTVWAEVLAVPEPSRDGDFFALGGDSLLATKVVARLRAAGAARAAISGLFTTPVLADFAATLTLQSPPVPSGAIAADPAARHQPFPPTELQCAYWVGRSAAFTLGGVGSYYYCEFDETKLDLSRLEAAWDRLIARHEMLRAVFDEDGRQRILPEVPRLAIPVTDSPEAGLDASREDLSHLILDPSRWPLFDVRAFRHEDGRTRICVGLDYLLVDGLSMMILFSELDLLYRDPDAVLPPIGVSFRDYVCQIAPPPAEAERSTQYWRRRIAELPPPPALPLAVDPATVARPRFVRRETWLAPEQWRSLQARARQHGFTPSAVLLACYTEVLATWSAQSEVTVALTLFDRQDVHPDIERVLGDFTSLLPVAHESVPAESFEAGTRRLQDRLWRDLDHRGAPVLGLLREAAGPENAAGASLPVVFTSALGVDDALSDALRRPVFSVSQTPQVWLDEQVMVRDGGLLISWDAVEELFPAGLLDAMFAAHGELLDQVCRTDWSEPMPVLPPPDQRSVRERVNATAGPLPTGTLHAGFFRQAAAEPGRCALRWGTDAQMTYGELVDRALKIAAMLRAQGVQPGELVAVSLPKGPDQIAAVLGVLAAGGAYLPIGLDQPVIRREHMLAAAGVRITVSDTTAAAGFEALGGPVAAGDGGLAYVIFTSGSTGVPKGVEVSHEAALNTVFDINDRHSIGPDDRVLAVSALDFDLSVYDIFGPLSVGGAVVLVGEDERRDAQHWWELARNHGVTVWNSVPVLLEMLLTVAQARGPLPGLRLALVSGDWVGVDLAARLAEFGTATCQLVALGGATEASIWSNSWDVSGPLPGWLSVPYGFPLRNQRFRVVGLGGGDCPDWVPGELWIGGAGVALGYRGDPVRTAEKFVWHEGERWYRTGDLGRYRPDGVLEFLGRTDHQLKINGHRLELGEVEAALTAHPAVHQAVVVPVGERGSYRLHAFAATTDDAGADTSLRAAELQAFLADRLPPYARPSGLTLLDALPLTANGKVDRGALKPSSSEPSAGQSDAAAPRGPVEAALAELWGGLLGRAAVPRHATFFALGGDSLQATRLVQWLRDRFGCELSLRQLLSEPTVAGLATLIERQCLDIEAEYMEDGTL